MKELEEGNALLRQVLEEKERIIKSLQVKQKRKLHEKSKLHSKGSSMID